MRVHLIKRQSIEQFARAYPASRIPMQEWLSKLKWADWHGPADIKSTFRSADLLGRGSQRVVFDVGGNQYRVICKYAFGSRQVHLFVCWVGTHAAYDKLNKRHEQYTINLF